MENFSQSRPTTVTLITQLHDGRHFLAEARRLLGGHLPWSAVIDLPDRPNSVVCLEICQSYDPDEFFEQSLTEENDLHSCALDWDIPTKLFLTNYPPSVTVDYCKALIGRLEVADCPANVVGHPGIMEITAPPDLPVMRHLRVIFENFHFLTSEAIHVSTCWQNCPVT
jgi:hypothetical protein